MIYGLCTQFSCLPSDLDEEDAGILKMLEIIRLGTKKEGGDDGVQE